MEYSGVIFMINEPVVFILGAGASSPYKFPLGYELVKQVYNLLQQKKNVQIFYDLDYDDNDINEFCKELMYSSRQSIDAFLEHRKEFIDLGKLAIAATLIPYEQEKSLINFDNHDNWYQFIFNKMNSTFDEFDQNKIKFITFNYDRSLEHFLFTSFKSSYGKSDDECAEKLKKIQIIHVHGQLGYLPWQNKSNNRPYNGEINFKNLKLSADMIKIIHEDASNNEEFKQAWKAFEEARSIYFLGFGYHETNMSRLKIQDYAMNKADNKIRLIHNKNEGMDKYYSYNRYLCGSAIGMTDNEIQIIEDKYKGISLYRPQYISCNSFLRDILDW